MFYATGQLASGRGAIFASQKGLEWDVVYVDERKQSPKAQRIYDIAVGEGILIAGGGNTSHGGDSCFFFSENGRQWHEGSGFTTTKNGKNNDFGATVFSVAYGDGKYIAHGGAPAHGWYFDCNSADGKQWSFPNKVKSFKIGSIYKSVFGRDRFIGIGGHNRVAVSIDGTIWTDADQEKVPPLIAIGFANGLFIGGGMHGLLASSHDGFEWRAIVKCCVLRL